MTALEELKWLRRSFPRSADLAVSAEMVDRLESEMVAMERFVAYGDRPGVARMFDEEVFPTFTARRVSLLFRAVPLTVVTPR